MPQTVEVTEKPIAPFGLPLMIQPRGRATVADLARLIDATLPRLHALQLRHGALLFRGFGTPDAADLARLTRAARETTMRYRGGSSPRTHVASDVYTSTELPRGVRIALHSELAYLDVYPRHLWFACVTPPAAGGETVIADARRVYRGIGARARRRFIGRRLRYRCSFHGPSALHALLDRVQKVTKSWMETFETTDPWVAEERCREAGAEVRWLPSGRMVMEIVRPAVVTHPETGETAWFNFAHLFRLNARCLGWRRYLLSRLFFVRAQTRTQDAHYGDGSEIDLGAIDEVVDVMDAETVAVPWQEGDVLWLDNLLCMHGRNPFSGPRRVLTAMTR